MDLFSDSRDVSATAFWIQPQGSQPDQCVCVSDKVVSEGVVCDKVVCGEWAAEAGEGGEVADGSAQQKQPAGGKTALAVVRFLQFYVAGAVAP